MNEEIKYVQLNEIVPGEIHPHLENDNDNLKNITKSIQKYGIITPLLVRPKGNFFEIILGNRRYKAAKTLNFKKIPVIIKELTDEQALEMIISDNIQRRELTTKEEALLYNQALSKNKNIEQLSNNLGIPLDRIQSKLNTIENKQTKNIINNQNNNKRINSNPINNDIINLSELNKEELERKEILMNNNDFLNNQNNNLDQMTQPNQNNNEPTIGEKFFPSLEDQPTNMNLNNMGQSLNQNTLNINNQSNLIDLTDISTTPQPSITESNNVQQSAPTPQEAINLNTPTTLNLDTQINLSNPANENSTPSENLTNILGNLPTMDTPSNPTQEPTTDLNQSTMNIPTPPIMEPALTPQPVEEPLPQPNLYQVNNEIPEPTPSPEIPSLNTSQEPKTPKNVTPVVNLIKNLALGVEELGFNLKIEENDGEQSYTIKIEVEK